MRVRIARDTERRLAGDVLAEALTRSPASRGAGRATAPVRARRGGRRAGVRDERSDRRRAAARQRPRGRRHPCARRRPRHAAVRDRRRPRASIRSTLARSMRAALAGEHGIVRAAASRTASAQSLRRSFHEARCALEAVRFANGAAPDVASHARSRLLSACCCRCRTTRRCARTATASSTASCSAIPTTPTSCCARSRPTSSTTAIGSARRAQVFCHRHTLRYRIRRVEELTNRSLANPRDRIEFWLALRGRELAL